MTPTHPDTLAALKGSSIMFEQGRRAYALGHPTEICSYQMPYNKEEWMRGWEAEKQNYERHQQPTAATRQGE